MSNTITQEQVEEIYKNSEIKQTTIFNKCTVVTAKLPNGFVISQASACVDEKIYDADIGYEICKEGILSKIWMLEGYRLQCELAIQKNDDIQKTKLRRTKDKNIKNRDEWS